jgi:hypothetical protein
MSFWKRFTNKTDDSDYEPAATGAMPAAVRKPDAKPRVTKKRDQEEPEEKSFDPYNSGAFQYRNAWDKVTRK